MAGVLPLDLANQDLERNQKTHSDIVHPLTKWTTEWHNCRDRVQINNLVQPVFWKGCVYTGGYSDGKDVVLKYSLLANSWSLLPTPPGVESSNNYTLTVYNGQLLWIGGMKKVTPNTLVTDEVVFSFDERSGWTELSTNFLPLPTKIGTYGLSATSQDKYLAVAWTNNSKISIMIFDGMKWKVIMDTLQTKGYGSVDVIINNDTIYLFDHSHPPNFYSSSIKSLIEAGSNSWCKLNCPLFSISNPTVFDDVLTVVTELPPGILAFLPGSNKWIVLSEGLSYGAHTIYVRDIPRIVYLPNNKSLLLMGRIKTEKYDQFLKFDVLEVLPVKEAYSPDVKISVEAVMKLKECKKLQRFNRLAWKVDKLKEKAGFAISRLSLPFAIIYDDTVTPLLKSIWSWIQDPNPSLPPTWRNFLEVLREPDVGFGDLADQIERNLTISSENNESATSECETSSEQVPKEDKAISKSSGHILRKHELQALAKLLAAYSDKRVKEIKLNVQKKGGEISREEVEMSLRDSGLTSIADGLKENLAKRVEDQEHYEAYELALKGGLALTMQYLKVLFFGPPRTGKSTARRRLVQEIVNLSSLGEPSASTGVAEANEVIIKKLTTEPVAISDSQWWSIKKSKELDGYSKEDCEYLAQMFYTLISKSASESKQVTTVPATISEPASFITLSKSEESVDAESTIIKGPSSPLKSLVLQNQAMPNTELQAETTFVSLISDSEEKEIDEAFKKLTSAIQSDSPEELHKLLRNLIMLNTVDIGGQPAFLELCPAFTAGPALYLIFFRLDQELRKNYQIKFQSADGVETILESSYCTETVIHQTLSSIACFGSQATTESAKSVPIGRALLFGTYKDKVDNEHISQMDSTLRQQLLPTMLHEEGLLLRTSADKLFYSLNNMTGDDSEMSPVRKDIDKIMKECFPAVPIPASWLMFRIMLHFLHKPVVSLVECKVIARRLAMSSPVRDTLWFFHHNIGSLMHYPDIPSMKDIVICNTQVVFDTTSELIIDTFKISNRAIPARAVDDFRKKGQFSLEHIKDRSQCHGNDQLSLEQLVDLLKHHNIIAEIKSSQERSIQIQPSKESSAQINLYQPKFVMPAVLPYATEEELKLVTSLSPQHASPLVIQFKGGFVPFGVFCASTSTLISRQESLKPRWNLCDDNVKRNRISFNIRGGYHVTLISRPQYIEIRVSRQEEGTRCNRTLKEICSNVKNIVVETIDTVVSKMKYKAIENFLVTSTERFHDFGFICSLNEHSEHLMKVVKDDNDIFAECCKSNQDIELKESHLVWFNGENKDMGKDQQSESVNVRGAPRKAAPNLDQPASFVTQVHTTELAGYTAGVKRKNEESIESARKMSRVMTESDTGKVNEAVRSKSDKPDACTTAIKKEILKSGQIMDPDRLFNDLAVDICKKPEEIGVELGLPYKVLENELETGKLMMKQGSKKAMKMLHMWQEYADKDNFTYEALAAALEKQGYLSSAKKFCYTIDCSETSE